MKKTGRVIIIKALIFCLFFMTVFTSVTVAGGGEVIQFAGGSGTESDPWRISTPEHLEHLRNYLGSEHSDKHFILINDLDLSEYLGVGGAGYHDGAGWEPIVDWVPDPMFPEDLNIVSFYGSLNGNGYKISNLYINRPDDDNVGLFGSVSNAFIINLGLENVSITGNHRVGGLTGAAYGATDIFHSYVTGNVISTGSGGYSYVGGLIGDFSGNGLINHSFFIGHISGMDYSGGLVGQAYQNNGLLSAMNSYAKGTVEGNHYTGGLFGYSLGLEIERVFFTGEVFGNSEVGGLSGRGYNVSVNQSHIEGDVTGSDMVGGLIGSQTSSHSGSSVVNSYVKGDVVGSADKVGGLLGRQYVFSNGTSTVSDSYAVGRVSGSSLTGGLIGSQEESGDKTVTSSYYNSEIAEQSDTDRGTPKTTAEMQEQSTYIGWDFTDAWGIESDKNDGYPYLKSNIVTNASPESGGTILVTGNFIQGEHVSVTTVAAEVYQFNHWAEDGIIVSRNSEYSFDVTGDRTLTAYFGTQVITATASPAAGGYVIGGAFYRPGDSVTVSASAAIGYTFVNWTEEGTEVSISPTYTFTADKDRSLVANFSPKEYMISADVYPVDGGTVIGAGSYYHGDQVSITAVPAEEYIFVNWTKDGTEVSTEETYTFTATEERHLTANFAKYQITTDANPAEGGSTTGNIYANEGDSVMVTAVANSGYSFVNWTENGEVVSTEHQYTFTVSGGRHLTANFSSWFGGGTGAESDPYQVKTAEHLDHIRLFLDNSSVYFIQTADIDLQGIWAEGAGWEPIGGNGWKSYFRGHYNGNGYKISNLTINRPDEGNVGLFGYISYEAEAKNIQLEEVTITGSSDVGALTGRLVSGTILNCHVSGNISGNLNVGGLVGANYSGTIQSSSSTGMVTGMNIDDERGIAYHTGGLVGVNDGTVRESFSEANVSGTSHVGGLAGSNESPKTIIDSYATGNVTGEGHVGGLVGLNNRTVINSYAVGTVDGNDHVGGLIGNNEYGTVEYSYYDSQVNGQDDETGKGTPLLTEEMKNQDTFINAGWDFNDIWSMDPLKNEGYPILNWQQVQYYTVIYDGNGNTGGTVPIDSNSYVQGATVTVFGNTGSLTRTGYTFAGWNTAGDGNGNISGTDQAAGSSFVMGTDNVTLYAKWTKKSNGGSDKNSNETNNQSTTPTETNTDIEVLVNGQMVKNMEEKEAMLEVKTAIATYILPAKQINIDAISAQIGTDIALEDIKIQVEIAQSTEETVQFVEDIANKGSFTIVVPPIEFTIKAIYEGQTVEVSKFNAYVERMIAIPEGIDPDKITTGVVVEPDGTVRHVPTQIVAVDGIYYAKINSLTNSIYTVVWNPQEFKDVENHWAKEAVNDMGSRMIVSGVGNGLYQPNREITRAEFAAIIVRALGLKPGEGTNLFTDVKETAWYSNYIKTAIEYGLITGYGDGQFKPMEPITREQAMTILERAMKLTGLEIELTEGEIEKQLSSFSDSDAIAEYAKNSIAVNVKSGLVTGRGVNLIAPKDNITRAEVATIVRRLLQKSDFI